MKRISIVLIALITLAFIGCGGDDNKHTHEWGEWVETIAPTCTAAAVETRVCILDATHKETREGRAALGHIFGEWSIVSNEHINNCQRTGCGFSKTIKQSDLYGEWRDSHIDYPEWLGYPTIISENTVKVYVRETEYIVVTISEWEAEITLYETNKPLYSRGYKIFGTVTENNVSSSGADIGFGMNIYGGETGQTGSFHYYLNEEKNVFVNGNNYAFGYTMIKVLP